MVATLPDSVDAKNKFEDLSGVDITKYENPYDALIEACKNDPAQIQARYETHRVTRNAQQKAKIIAPDFEDLLIDPILKKLEDPSIEPGFMDPRNCLVFWARPPGHIRDLVGRAQQELRKVAPHLWLMPLQNLHLTALELCHSLTFPETEAIVSSLGSPAYTEMTDYTLTHRARLIKPTLSYDTAAIALSFLPAAGKEEDNFTYHHLRRDLFSIAKRAGVQVDSRYVVPSSHITIGRFLGQGDHDSIEKRKAWMEKIEEVNVWLEKEFWPSNGEDEEGFEWVVGMEKGLDFRQGTLWYGGGETIRLGKGF
ncbi:hypothetical protein M7I_0438 [Glarea lozoyensis 74030]|uniref:RNA ligase/cyclic nucleotide phosphodiesterase n=1 Tax=Glarea lozoyensis (strain ATCC 74030 / MF5533) TaxID=1104152 RepID=H0EDD0_GLAL7|nr:hypothetical protein M7I_0438 [Glarea lozoyensis 74030]